MRDIIAARRAEARWCRENNASVPCHEIILVVVEEFFPDEQRRFCLA